MKYINSINFKHATGTLSDIYSYIHKELGPAGKMPGGDPASLHSLHPDLMRAWWNTMKETVIIEGNVPRNYKESIAVGISMNNDCILCIDQHAAILGAMGDAELVKSLINSDFSHIIDKKQLRMIYWALGHDVKDAHFVKNPPYDMSEAAEVIGTATVVNYINRLVEIFLGDSILSSRNKFVRSTLRKFSTYMIKRLGKKSPESDTSAINFKSAQNPQWVNENGRVGKAWSAFISEIDKIGNQFIPNAPKSFFEKLLSQWEGATVPNMVVSNYSLSENESFITDYLKKVAFQPKSITKKDIKQLRALGYGDDGILGITCWASLKVSLRISEWLFDPVEEYEVIRKLIKEETRKMPVK